MRTYIKVKAASCAKHGEVRIVAHGETAICERCLDAIAGGRAREVFELDADGGGWSLPVVEVTPCEPTNFISIRAQLVKGAES